METGDLLQEPRDDCMACSAVAGPETPSISARPVGRSVGWSYGKQLPVGRPVFIVSGGARCLLAGRSGPVGEVGENKELLGQQFACVGNSTRHHLDSLALQKRRVVGFL